MRIVFTSNLYLPVMGGSVMVLDRWAHTFLGLGHEVTILTRTPGQGLQDIQEWRKEDPSMVRVCRFHRLRDCVEVLRQADRVIMIEMSLNWLLAIALAGRRPLCTHHTHVIPPDGKMRMYRWIQLAAGYLIPSVACSRMIAKQWGFHVGVAPNPYDERVFHSMNLEKDVDFLFAGRFGPEKGLNIFISAIRRISEDFHKTHGRIPRVVIAGKGPEDHLVRELLDDTHPVCEAAHFGEASPAELAMWYNRAKVAVIPSVWQEPFGLIGIEALACGCRIVCSDQPGLREATGGLARYCATGNVEDFAGAMMAEVCIPPFEKDTKSLEEHLARHHLAGSATALLECSSRYHNRQTFELLPANA